MVTSVEDPDPNPDQDPHVFVPLRSRSIVRGSNPDPNPLVRGMDPDPDPAIIIQK